MSRDDVVLSKQQLADIALAREQEERQKQQEEETEDGDSAAFPTVIRSAGSDLRLKMLDRSLSHSVDSAYLADADDSVSDTKKIDAERLCARNEEGEDEEEMVEDDHFLSDEDDMESTGKRTSSFDSSPMTPAAFTPSVEEDLREWKASGKQ